MNSSWLYFLITLFCFAPNAANATSALRFKTPGGDAIASAKYFERDSDKQIMELKGDVQLIYDNQHISCDHAIIHQDTEEIEAEGHLVIASPTIHVEGDRAHLSYKDNTGIIYHGFVQSGQVIFEGEVVRKMGPLQYEADDGYYTACTTCPPAWSFTGSHIRAELGGYAHISKAWFRVANFPILPLPYIVVPLKSERQSGLLTPTLEFGSGGVTPGLRYFWAISRSQDATVTVKNYAHRGPKGLLNYRYMLSPNSEGEMNAGLIRDKSFALDPQYQVFKQFPVSSDYPDRPKINRWFFNYNHTYDLPEGFTQKTRLNLLSDFLYMRDYPDESIGYGEPALENRLTLSHTTDITQGGIDLGYYVSTLKSNPVTDNNDATQRMPELRFSVAEQNIADTGLLFHIDSNYVNFTRGDFAFDSIMYNCAPPTGKQTNLPFCVVDRSQKVLSAPAVDPTVPGFTPQPNLFNPAQDVIRTGQRFDTEPEISYPMHLGKYFDALSSLSYRYTQYAFAIGQDRVAGNSGGYDSTPLRQYATFNFSTRTRFSEVFLPDDPFDARYKHEIIPEVYYSNIPYYYETKNDFFQGSAESLPSFLTIQPVSDSDIPIPDNNPDHTKKRLSKARRIQFDYFDRVQGRNLLTFVLDNRLIRKKMGLDMPDYKQIVSFKVAQSYDFEEAYVPEDQGRFPWSDISSLLDVRLDNFETNTATHYYPYHNKTDTAIRVKVMDIKGDFVQVAYSRKDNITSTIDQSEASPPTQSISLGLGTITRYADASVNFAYQPRDQSYTNFFVSGWGGALLVKPPGNCWSISIIVNQVYSDSPTYRFGFDYNFGGSPAGPGPEVTPGQNSPTNPGAPIPGAPGYPFQRTVQN